MSVKVFSMCGEIVNKKQLGGKHNVVIWPERVWCLNMIHSSPSLLRPSSLVTTSSNKQCLSASTLFRKFPLASNHLLRAVTDRHIFVLFNIIKLMQWFRVHYISKHAACTCLTKTEWRWNFGSEKPQIFIFSMATEYGMTLQNIEYGMTLQNRMDISNFATLHLLDYLCSTSGPWS